MCIRDSSRTLRPTMPDLRLRQRAMALRGRLSSRQVFTHICFRSCGEQSDSSSLRRDVISDILTLLFRFPTAWDHCAAVPLQPSLLRTRDGLWLVVICLVEIGVWLSCLQWDLMMVSVKKLKPWFLEAMVKTEDEATEEKGDNILFYGVMFNSERKGFVGIHNRITEDRNVTYTLNWIFHCLLYTSVAHDFVRVVFNLMR